MSDKAWSLQHFLKFLENPSYPSVGPHLKLLGLVGLWRSDPTASVSRFKQFLFYFTITFFFSQYIKCLIKFNAESLKLILQYAPFHMGIVKSCFFQKNFSRWQNLIDYMSLIERSQLKKEDKNQSDMIESYIKRNRRISYFFWALAFFSNFSIFTEPYQKNQINMNGTSVYLYIFDGYTPFRKEPPGYYMSMLIQTVLGHVVSAYVVGWDTLVVSIMIFFAGQLKISRLHCSQTIDASSPEKSHENIANCHRFHVNLIKHQKLFNSLISPVMFIYLINISVNLGVCIFEIVESTLTSYGTFKSDWPSSSKKLRQEIALLGLTTTKRLVFKAGPFNEMSLPTFIAILRASYSFYTLLHNKN
ncbi:unnamed protein product [Arctia plantaginis]|uniref:Odorant receptor n=1 Tax=Arctia plantaginis TaxID=874455 RepID=A0A8S1AGD4_ARCPL|nr:unnamed protein product [Arctia plantaginis]